MALIIASLTFFSSLAGLAYILKKKMPLILALPENTEESLVETLKNGVGNVKALRWFPSPEIFLQTLLSKTRIYAMRLEQKTNDWLVSLRKQSQEKSEKFTQGYWKELKKR